MSATLPAPARWPGRQAKRLRPPHAHMAMAARTGSTQAAASMPLCWLECCVPPMAHSTNKGTHTQHTPPSSRSLARSCVHARGINVWDHTSPIVHARLATHSSQATFAQQSPALHNERQSTLQPATHCCEPAHPGRPARAMRHGPAHASASSESGPAHAAARQRQHFAAQIRERFTSLPRALNTELAHMRLMKRHALNEIGPS